MEAGLNSTSALHPRSITLLAWSEFVANATPSSAKTYKADWCPACGGALIESVLNRLEPPLRSDRVLKSTIAASYCRVVMQWAELSRRSNQICGFCLAPRQLIQIFLRFLLVSKRLSRQNACGRRRWVQRRQHRNPNRHSRNDHPIEGRDAKGSVSME